MITNSKGIPALLIILTYIKRFAFQLKNSYFAVAELFPSMKLNYIGCM